MPNDDCLTMENVFGKETESSWMWLERHGFVGDSTKENWCIGKIPERLSFLENLRLVVKRCVDDQWYAEVFFDRGSDDESASPKYSTATYEKPQEALSIIIDYLEKMRKAEASLIKKCEETMDALFPFRPADLDSKEQWLLDHGFGRCSYGPIWKRVFTFDEKEIVWTVQTFNDANWMVRREYPEDDGGHAEAFGVMAASPHDAVFHLVEKLHKENIDFPELEHMKKE